MHDFSLLVKPHLNQDMMDQSMWLGSAGAMDRAAAVLFPFYWKDGSPWVLLTQRNANLKHHSGQVSFPGGAFEESDKNIKHTALRETQEEIGVIAHDIELWGFLDSLPSISGFHVTPFVGAIKDVTCLDIDKNEVERVFGVPFAFFQDHKNRVKNTIRTPAGDRAYYVFKYKDNVIWGLTAQIIVQLVDRINK